MTTTPISYFIYQQLSDKLHIYNETWPSPIKVALMAIAVALIAALYQHQIELITNSKHLKIIIETIIPIPIYHYKRIHTMNLAILLIALKTIIVTKETIITIKYKKTLLIPDTNTKPISSKLLIQHISNTFTIQFLNYNIPYNP